MRIKRTSTIAVFILAIMLGKGSAMAETNGSETATLAGGCFWCLEAIFEELDGVKKVESGFAGGDDSATYKEVCTGETGHAEVIQVTFDPEATSFREILGVFFAVHDPTTLNRQGADVGTQYRSAVFYHDEAQKAAVEDAISVLHEEKVWPNPVVTEVAPFTRFFMAEAYHQDYYKNNKAQGYCQVVINPKLKKFREKFADKLKK